MAPRLSHDQLSPDAYKGLYATYVAISEGPLSKTLFELVSLLVSQINGCAYWMERHAQTLREEKETNDRINTVGGWGLSPHFTERERAALAWADLVTNIAECRAYEHRYAKLKEYFSDAEISDLTFAISIMNALNRLAIHMRR